MGNLRHLLIALRVTFCISLGFALGGTGALAASNEAGAIDASQGEPGAYLTQRRNLRFTHLTVEHGLSQDSVMDIVQDHQGYIWIATQDGLNRYDGVTVTLFEHDPFDEASLRENFVWSLLVTHDGELWVGTNEGGINRYNAETESFTAIRHDPNNTNSISSDRIRSLHQDDLGFIWAGTVSAGLNRIDLKTNEVRRFSHDAEDASSLPNDTILTINDDSQGRIWVGTDGGGLARYDRSTNNFIRYAPSDNEHSLSGSRVSSIVEDRDGTLWVGTRDGGLNRLNMASGKFEHFAEEKGVSTGLSNKDVRDILEDDDGTLWISTDNGLNEWRPQAKAFVHYFADDSDDSALSDSRVASLFQSADGVLWVGSNRGINRWNYLSDAFTHYRKNEGHLGADIVTSIAESADSNLWIGTYGGGLTQLDRATGNINIYRSQKKNSNSISNDRIMALFVDANSIVWAGTRRDGLNRLDPSTGDFTLLKKPVLSSNRISALFGEPDGTMWVGTYGGGLNRIRPDGQVTMFEVDADNAQSLSGNRVLSITQDLSGKLWIATEDGGLNLFNRETETFNRFQHDPRDPDSISSNATWEIYESSDGSLWIGTMNSGLNQWTADDRRNGIERFKKWTKANGLRSNTTYGILEDDAGHLWISGNRGISRMNLETGGMRHYDRRNGLIGDEFNQGARLRSRSGQFLFGGSEGVVAFEPGQIQRNESIPAIALGGYSPFGRLGVRYSGTPNKKPVNVLYTDNFVAFEFAALDYTSPDKNEFRYMLEGFDSTWQNPDKMRRITYANLSAGSYLFRVKAANNDGVWNEEGAVMAVIVEAAPWLTKQAYAGYAALLGLLVIYFFRQLRRRREQEKERREELERLVLKRTSELGERNHELEELNDKLLEASFTDSLTGLYNRRYLDQFIDQQVSAVEREGRAKQDETNTDFGHYQQSVLFFMMIDLDGFKAINDTFGHAAGDMALLQVRDELVESARKSDTIIRWGGDEFLIVGRTRGLAGIANFAERVRLAVSDRSYDVGDGNIAQLSCSVGSVPYPLAPLKTDLMSWEQCLNLADAGAYIVKSNGRNGWFVMAADQTMQAHDAAALPKAVHALIEDGKLHYSSSLAEPIAFITNQKTVA